MKYLVRKFTEFCMQYNSHRGETWYELFYDLVFVASALQIGYIVKYDISFLGLVKSGIIFTMMRACWDQLMFYQNRFDTKDMVHFIFYLLQAMFAFVMALHLTLDHHHNWDEERNLKPFAIAAALSRVVIVVMYFQVMSLTKKYRTHLRLLVASQAISGALFFVSAYTVHEGTYYYLWTASILVERGLVHSYIAWTVPPKQRAPPHFGHLSHRQGTFIMLILGEAIIQLVQSSCGQSASAYARGLMGFAVVFNVGDVYYQQQVVGRLTFLTENSTPFTTLWTALHLILSLSMLFFAVAVKMVYSNECESRDRLQKEEFFMCVSASVSMVIIFFLRMTHKGIWYKGKRIRGYSYLFRFFIAFVCAFIPYVTNNALSSIGLLFGLTSCLVVQDLFSHRGVREGNSHDHTPDDASVHPKPALRQRSGTGDIDLESNLTPESLARLGNGLPHPDVSNTSSFFYTDDSYGRDDFVRKSNLAHNAGLPPVARRPSLESAPVGAVTTSISTRHSQSSDGSMGSAAVAAIGAVHSGRDGSIGKKKKNRKAQTLQEPLIPEENSSS
ncbi:unnamed protein product [Symbiodinium microadriaticum]|nr:unnamed protein product [Symbiodinium microadriaticum]